MVQEKKQVRGLMGHLDLSKLGEKEQLSRTVAMALDFMKHQGEVAYEVGKRQAMALTSTASTIGIGWSAFFFGIMQESWLSSSIGLMLVFGGTYLLAFWTPKVLDKVRQGLEATRAAEFYKKWASDSPKSEIS